MDLIEQLRHQARRYNCQVCGTNMAGCRISVLAKQSDRALVRVTCASCSDENLYQVVFQAAEGVAERRSRPPRRGVVDEGFPEKTEPISVDELLDVHSALARHEGGLKELARTS